MTDYPDDAKYRSDHKRELEYIDESAGTSTFFNLVEPPIHGDEAFKGLITECGKGDQIFIVTWMCDPEMELVRDGWDQPVNDPLRQTIRIAPVLLAAAQRKATLSMIIWDPTGLVGSNAAQASDSPYDLPHPDILVETVGPDEWKQGAASSGREFIRIVSALRKLRADLRAISQENEILLLPHPTTKAGSHHQKFWIRRKQQNLAAFVGGINLNQLAWDDVAHEPLNPRRNPQDMPGADRKARFDKNDPPKDLPRHDWMIRVEGHAAFALLEEFYSRWSQSPLAPPKQVLKKPTDVEQSGKLFVQVSRCWPKDPAPTQILKVYQKAFGKATRYIYVENQYWTNAALTDLVIKQLTNNSLLRFVIVLPFKPEEDGIVSEWIVSEQNYQLGRIMDAIHNNDRVQVYQLYRKNPARNEYYNVYVHAKLAIVDDCWMTVGSANTNNRSMELCDSESNVQIANADFVVSARKQIWSEMVGGKEGAADDADDAIMQGFYWFGVKNINLKRDGKDIRGMAVMNTMDQPKGKRPPEWARKFL